MFNDIKGGYVVLMNGGKVRTQNVAVFSSEAVLYAKVSGGWYSTLKANGKTSGDMGWRNLVLPRTWERIEDTNMGYVQVQSIARKTAKRLGVK